MPDTFPDPTPSTAGALSPRGMSRRWSIMRRWASIGGELLYVNDALAQMLGFASPG